MIWVLAIPAVLIIAGVLAVALTRAVDSGDESWAIAREQDDGLADLRAQHEEAA